MAFCKTCGAAVGAVAAAAAAPPAEARPEGPTAPAPPGRAQDAGGPPRRGPSPALLIVIIVLVVAAAAAATVILFLVPRGDDHNPTPAPVASASTSAPAASSPAPSPTSSPYMAAATGASANVLSMWIADMARGDVAQVHITTPAVAAVDSVAWLNGRELLVAGFTVTPKAQGEVAELLVYDAIARAVEGLLQNDSGVSLRGVSASASSDGAKVAYVTYADARQDQYGMRTATERLELFDRSTGTITELGKGEALFDVNARRFDDPLISPGGDAVIYRQAGSDVGTSCTIVDVTGASGDPTLFFIFDKAIGGAAKIIARYKNTNVQDLSWSPDGSTIAFAEYDQKHYDTGNIFQMSPSGGDAQKLAGHALLPAYKPSP